MTCWFSGTQRTRTSATFLSAAESDVSTGLSRKTDIVAPNLHAIHYITLVLIICRVAEWLASRTQSQKGLGSNRSRDAVG